MLHLNCSYLNLFYMLNYKIWIWKLILTLSHNQYWYLHIHIVLSITEFTYSPRQKKKKKNVVSKLPRAFIFLCAFVCLEMADSFFPPFNFFSLFVKKLAIFLQIWNEKSKCKLSLPALSDSNLVMPGKSWELRNLVPRKVCDLEGIFQVLNKEIHKKWRETSTMFLGNWAFFPTVNLVLSRLPSQFSAPFRMTVISTSR